VEEKNTVSKNVKQSNVVCIVQCYSQTHRSSDKKCKQYGLQLEMNRLMACEKHTYMEAKEKVEKTIPTDKDFPHLITNVGGDDLFQREK
jgi:hypothetical protein